MSSFNKQDADTNEPDFNSNMRHFMKMLFKYHFYIHDDTGNQEGPGMLVLSLEQLLNLEELFSIIYEKNNMPIEVSSELSMSIEEKAESVLAQIYFQERVAGIRISNGSINGRYVLNYEDVKMHFICQHQTKQSDVTGDRSEDCTGFLLP